MITWETYKVLTDVAMVRAGTGKLFSTFWVVRLLISNLIASEV